MKKSNGHYVCNRGYEEVTKEDIENAPFGITKDHFNYYGLNLNCQCYDVSSYKKHDATIEEMLEIEAEISQNLEEIISNIKFDGELSMAYKTLIDKNVIEVKIGEDGIKRFEFSYTNKQHEKSLKNTISAEDFFSSEDPFNIK